MSSLATAEAGMPDINPAGLSAVKETPTHIYSLFTGDMIGAGARAHEILERTSVHVINGIGVVADTCGHGPHVLFETARPVTKKASRRLGNAGLHLVAGEPITL